MSKLRNFFEGLEDRTPERVLEEGSALDPLVVPPHTILEAGGGFSFSREGAEGFEVQADGEQGVVEAVGSDMKLRWTPGSEGRMEAVTSEGTYDVLLHPRMQFWIWQFTPAHGSKHPPMEEPIGPDEQDKKMALWAAQAHWEQIRPAVDEPMDSMQTPVDIYSGGKRPLMNSYDPLAEGVFGPEKEYKVIVAPGEYGADIRKIGRLSPALSQKLQSAGQHGEIELNQLEAEELSQQLSDFLRLRRNHSPNSDFAEDVLQQIARQMYPPSPVEDFREAAEMSPTLKKSSEKEKREHPWLSDKEAVRVATDHMKEAAVHPDCLACEDEQNHPYTMMNSNKDCPHCDRNEQIGWPTHEHGTGLGGREEYKKEWPRVLSTHIKLNNFRESVSLKEFFQINEISSDPHKYYIVQSANKDAAGEVDLALVDVDPASGGPASATPQWDRYSTVEEAFAAIQFDNSTMELEMQAQQFWQGVDHTQEAMVVDPSDKRQPLNTTTRWEMKAYNTGIERD
jgi:hypothetical protein